MYRRRAACALLIAGGLFAQEIHLKTRTMQTGATRALERPGAHRIIQFDHSPGVEDLDALLAAGVKIVGAVPDNGVAVTMPPEGVAPQAGVRWSGGFDPDDKLSPALGSVEPIAAIVEFHPDVSPDEQDSVAGSEGVTLSRPPALLANHAIVNASTEELRSLAAHDGSPTSSRRMRD